MRQCAVCGSEKTSLFCPVEDRDREGVVWEVWRCASCGYGWTRPWIGPDRIGDYYPPAYLGDSERMLDAYAAGALQRKRSWRQMVGRRRFVERLVKRGRILDVGCSNAGFLLTLEPTRWERYGVEYIGAVVRLVRERISQLQIFEGDIFHADLEPGSFDVVTFWHVLEHLHEPRRVLARTAELLKPGGWVVIAVPNFASRQAEWFREHWFAFDVPRHLHHFSPRSLDMLLQEENFGEIQHHFFSRLENMHQLKHSLIHWSEARFSSRIPYYFMKPILFAVHALEARTRRFGILAAAARLQTR